MEVEVKVQTKDPKSGQDNSFASFPASGGGNANTGKSKKQITTAVVAVVLLSAAAFGAYKIFGPDKAKTAEVAASGRAVLTVQLTPVKRSNFERRLLVTGTVYAWDPVQVGSEISGLRVESIAVDEGAHVKKGQVMASLNSSILRAQLAQQEARLASSRAGLTKAIQPNRPEDLNTLQAAYSQAEVNVAQEEANLMRSQATAAEAEANAKRYEYLVKQGVVSGMEGLNRSTVAKTSVADVHSAQERVKAARFAAKQAHEKLTMGVAGGRNEDVAMSKASVAELVAMVSQLNSEVAQTFIRSPCDGIVVKRSVHIGDIASSAKVMFELVRDGRLELRAQVPESDLSSIKPGQKVDVQPVLPADPIVEGSVREISPTIDLDSRLGTVKIDLPAFSKTSPTKELFRSGNFARAEILLGKEAVLAIPASCVVYKDNRAIVFTVSSEGKTQMHFVEAGERALDEIEVKSGLHDGDLLVAKGAGFLKDGDKVKVAPQP